MVESSAKLQLSLVLANLAKENLYLRPEMRQLIIFFFLIFAGELQAQSIDSIFVSVPKKVFAFARRSRAAQSFGFI